MSDGLKTMIVVFGIGFGWIAIVLVVLFIAERINSRNLQRWARAEADRIKKEMALDPRWNRALRKPPWQ